MSDEKIYNAIIVGSGPSGYTAGIYLSRANLEPLLLAGPQIGGQLTTTTDVENFPGFPTGVDGTTLMMDMEKQARNYGTEILYEKATGISRNDDHFKVETSAGTKLARTVVIASGASPKMPGFKGEDTFWNYGVHTCAVCDGGFYRKKKVLVIGGGDSAMEEASYLAKLCEKVYVVHRRDELRASKIMADRALENPKIEFLWNSAVEEVVGTVEGEHKKKTEKAIVKNLNTDEKTEVEVSAVFIAIGHQPNTDWVGDFVETNNHGYVIVSDSLKTNQEGIFAAGDVHDSHYRQAITAAGFGCMAALEAERYLSKIGVVV